jgi:hypothetical protein
MKLKAKILILLVVIGVVIAFSLFAMGIGVSQHSTLITKSDKTTIVRVSDNNYLQTEIIPVFHKIGGNSF